ncbi:hypothetical protein SAMN05518672_11224 [Chitinophaga sp. CF118]|uniref:hypothetical protein n=1 Tax=Chitinophaga sp. CF118 TaxID=1884367 RepID=UPI0008E5EEF1|nr:hypothetical protein [Chitinophaga sp. CF118]SFE91247.1 hypothetical protein SAMN05518672_11224 [Chitinophaga sp. CF118]
MRIFFVLSLLFSISLSGIAQVKIVKIPDEGFYLNFFYKQQKSDYIKNDSTSYLCRKISMDSFYLDKVVNERTEWTKIFTIGQLKDRMIVYVRRTGSRVVKTKKEYFVAEPVAQ